MKLLRAALVCWTLAAGIALAGPVEDLVRQYEDGTMFAADRGWDAWRERTSNRKLELTTVRADDGRTWAVFHERADVLGEPRQLYGVVVVEHPDGVLTNADWHTMREKPRCMAAATGQAADLGTTAIALTQGFAEGNPLGLALIPIKIAAYSAIRTMPLYACIREMQSFGKAGYMAAGWNLGFVVGGPPVGAVLAIAGAVLLMSEDEAAIECAGC